MENLLVQPQENAEYATVSIEIANTENEVAEKLRREGFREFMVSPCAPNATFDNKLPAGKHRFSVSLSMAELRKL